MQTFTTFKDASLACRIISFVLNDKVSVIRDGNVWLVQSKIDFYVALLTWRGMSKREEFSCSTDAWSAWESWRKVHAGTYAYSKVEEESMLLVKSLRTSNEIALDKLCEEESAELEAAFPGNSNEQTGHWGGYDWIDTKNKEDGEDLAYGLRNYPG